MQKIVNVKKKDFSWVFTERVTITHPHVVPNRKTFVHLRRKIFEEIGELSDPS